MKALFVLLLLTACSSKTESQAEAPPPPLMSCHGEFQELGPYKGVTIKCDDGRQFLYWPNKYIYSKKPIN